MTRKGLRVSSVNSSRQSLHRMETLPQETYPSTPNADINCSFVPKPAAVPSYAVWEHRAFGDRTAFRELVCDLFSALSKFGVNCLTTHWSTELCSTTVDISHFTKTFNFQRSQTEAVSLPQRVPFAQHLSGIWSTLPATRMTIV